jgi:yecA family protein
MDQRLHHDALDAALRRSGASWDAAQTHGLLAGQLAIGGSDGGFEWLAQVLEGTNEADVLRAECAELLSNLFEMTYRQLAERLSEFKPLLPDDETSMSDRTAALARWCEGFLHGLVSREHGADLKERLSAQPLADIIKDVLEITRATADEDADSESEEAAFVEIVEYVRVAAQLTYEELADFRHKAVDEKTGSDALH